MFWKNGLHADRMTISQYLLIITSYCYIKEVLVISQFLKGRANVAFKIIPPQAEFFAFHLEQKFQLTVENWEPNKEELLNFLKTLPSEMRDG